LLVVSDDRAQQLDLFVEEGTSTSVAVDLSLHADTIGVTASNTSDLGKGEQHLLLTVDVGVQHTQNVLELRGHKETLSDKTKSTHCMNKSVSRWKRESQGGSETVRNDN
jgi:hypothetical protein